MRDSPSESFKKDPSHKAGSWRTPILIIVGMVIAFVFVVVYRQEIRVRWWAYRLGRVSDVADRMAYLELLASAGELSLPVADKLIQDPDAGNRSFGIVLLNALKGDEVERLLVVACNDRDASNRRSAILGLSMRRSVKTVERLADLIDELDSDSAMFVVSRLVGIDFPESFARLSRVARSHVDVGVRAQAIDALGQWSGRGGSRRTVDVLIECLSDDAVFGGLTATESMAQEALAFAAPHQVGSNGAAVVRHPGDTNGERACRVLRSLTGKSFAFLEADKADRLSAIRRWRAWYESQNDG
ncbi:MAG: HEAT repeat domain-containing protein [Planctomycetes bacterium]|nr:HEAT repeat domain-containing protein [Planctomycetota bacterium]